MVCSKYLYNLREILNLSRPSYSGTLSGIFAYGRAELQLPPTFIYSLQNRLQLLFIHLSPKSYFVLQRCQYYSYLHFPFFFGKSVDPS